MTCEACTLAHAELSHLFHAGCRGCCARALARGPHFHRCRKNGMQDRHYRAALQQFSLTHEEVVAEAALDCETGAPTNRTPETT